MFAAVSAAALWMMGMAATSFAAPTNAPTNTPTASPTTLPTATVTNVQNGWVSEADGKETVWCYYANGVRYRSQWVKSNDRWYYMNSDGVMVTGWQTIGNTDYFFDTSGAMATGWRKLTSNDSVNNTGTYFGPMGNNSSSSSNWYYFATATTGKGFTEGAMVQGWLSLGDNWYYLADNNVDSENIEFGYGQMVYGEVMIDGHKYYFGKENEGVMRTGFIKAADISSTTASSNGPGSAASSDKEGMYYYGTSGSTIGVKWEDAWLGINNEWYYFDEEGKMVTGRMATDSKGKRCDYEGGDAKYYYYLDPSSGKMQTGWVSMKESDSVVNGPLSTSTSEKYYQYYGTSGAMHFGWLNLGGKYYYLANQDDLSDRNGTFSGYVLGQMVTDYKEIEKDAFFFNKSGVMEVSTWKEINGESYYFGSNGAMVKSKSEDNLEIIKKSSRSYPIDTDGSPLPEGEIVYYNGTRYSLTAPSTIKKTYSVHANGYLVEVKN